MMREPRRASLDNIASMLVTEQEQEQEQVDGE